LAMYKRGGVSVAFDGLLIHGPRAMKADSRRKRAFVSVEYPLLGEMRDRGSHKTAWLAGKVPALDGGRPWGDRPAFETDIALVPVFPGMRPAFLDAVAAAAPKAVVLEGFGLGGVPCTPGGDGNLLPAIRRGIEAGIPFVLRTQAPFGGTDPFVYEVGRKALDLGVIDARDMTREALMVKLMLLLAGKEKLKEKLEERLHAGVCDEIARL
ncbi:MAG: hypothetical protein LBL51_03670, partial [Synergistaceae bacterium]|nr:hypothetical protein [Synergistaceae bacterium]